MTVLIDGDLMTVVEFLHVKPGKGSAFVRTKLRNLKSGYVIEKTFRAGEKVPRAHVEKRDMNMLYMTDDEAVFMDNENFEQISVPKDLIGEGVKWLKDNTTCGVLFYEGAAIGVDVPNFVELQVTQTDPGFKGDTATGGTKPATLETGAVINVPLFVEIGDVLQIDTRSGSYLKRV
jgi:elongation factor P